MTPRDFLRSLVEFSSDEAEWLTQSSTNSLMQAIVDLHDPLARVTHLRQQGLSARQATLVAELTELRRRGADKFTLAPRLFFTRRSLEQATDETIANYKAQRFPLGATIADLCCGMGGDALGLSRRGALTLVDRDPALLHLAQHNLTIAGATDWVARAEEAQANHVRTVVAWHIDPDRRVAGRVTSVQEMTPALPVLHELLRVNPHAAIKLAPATPATTWPTETAREWIGHQRECQQQVLWSGQLAQQTQPLRATVLDAQGNPTSLDGTGTELIPRSNQLGEFIYEPSPPVLAAGLVGALAGRYELASASDDRAYLTGGAIMGSPLLSSFRIRDVLPFRTPTLKAYLGEHRLHIDEIKRRGVKFELENVRRQLTSRAGGSDTVGVTLIVLSRSQRALALLADRQVSTKY